MQVLSLSTLSRFQGKKLKKIFVWAFALIMFGVSCFAILKAMNILAAESGWTITADGSGLLNVLTATSDSTGTKRTAYCIDPYTDFTSTYPEYVASDETADMSGVQALLKRAYPVLTAKQMGIVYLNDASVTDLEAYEATQIAIWETVTNGEYEVNEVLVGRQFELVNALLSSDVVINDGSWITIDTSNAVRQSTSMNRDSYGPIAIAVNTGSERLDAAIKNENLTLSPAATDRSWVFSSSSSVSGSATSTIRAGNSYYINYLKAEAGTFEFSIAGGDLANSNSLDDMDEIISIYGADVNQVLGVVRESAKAASSANFNIIGGKANMTLRKTWRCASSSACLATFGDTIYFDIYEKIYGGGYSLIDTVDTEYNSSMSPNTAQTIASNIELKTYTEYIVIERTEVQPTLSVGDVVPSVTSTYGTAGKYKISNGVPVAANSGEAYYAGVKFLSGINDSTETVSAENKSVQMGVTLHMSATIDSIYSQYSSYIPSETNVYIYASTDGGSSWSSVAGPVKLYDYANGGSSTDYSFNMTYGTKYRVIEDWQMYDVNVTETCYRRNLDSSAYITGSNYSNIISPRVAKYGGYSSTASASSSSSFPGSTSYSGYAGFEWDAGWSDSVVYFNINNDFNLYSSTYTCNPQPPDPEPEEWSRSLSIRKLTSGNNPDGWASNYGFEWSVAGSSYNSDDAESVSTGSTNEVFSVEGEDYKGNFPTLTYMVMESPLSFCAGKREVVGVVNDTIDGVTKTTTTTATSSTGFSVSGSYNYIYTEYATANCASGEITGSWSGSRPSSGTYAARVRVVISSGNTYDDNIVVQATNSFSTQSSISYSSDDDQSGVALILKYGYDGVNTVATYLDGTEFEIYDDEDTYVMDWTLSANDRGKYGSVSGTSNYYVSPELPVGEYYLKEVSAVPGYYADTESKYFFAISAVDDAPGMSITPVRKNGVSGENTNFGKAILNSPTYELAAFKFKRKVLAGAIEDSHIELFRMTKTTAEPAYGNENLRGYEKVAEFDSLVDGIIIEELVYGWYKLVEVTPPNGYIGPEPEVAVGFSAYVGPTTLSANSYSGARVYIANDWVGIEEPPVEPDPEEEVPPEVPKTGVMGKTKMNGGMVAATFLGMGSALVIGIALFVGKKLTNEIEEDGTIKLRK